jgi:hypothetical protein
MHRLCVSLVESLDLVLCRILAGHFEHLSKTLAKKKQTFCYYKKVT